MVNQDSIFNQTNKIININDQDESTVIEEDLKNVPRAISVSRNARLNSNNI